MLRGLYQATSAMVIAKTKQEIISGNVANADTAGFKRQVLPEEVFAQAMLLARLGPGSRELGDTTVKTVLAEPVTDFSQGQLVHSDDNFHLALHGNGFFAILTEEGPRYTRAGDFRIDAAGFLSDAHGGRILLDNWQPIQIKGIDFAIESDGTIMMEGGPRGRLMITDFAEPAALVKDARGQFIGDEAVPFPGTARVVQNSLERSNVDPAQELIDMMLVNRIFESAQRIVSTYDQLMEKAKEIGSIR
ncbi:MAG: flagellar basal-body rod protein FlgF [Bacillota bacterium]|nr:MAG: flagellar basal-body rod protein FlgF [Bacillota bacterium]MBS3951247.1 flagellar hook-basal body protein [Peptococcaceae bacterium]